MKGPDLSHPGYGRGHSGQIMGTAGRTSGYHWPQHDHRPNLGLRDAPRYLRRLRPHAGLHDIERQATSPTRPGTLWAYYGGARVFQGQGTNIGVSSGVFWVTSGLIYHIWGRHGIFAYDQGGSRCSMGMFWASSGATIAGLPDANVATNSRYPQRPMFHVKHRTPSAAHVLALSRAPVWLPTAMSTSCGSRERPNHVP